MALRAAASRLPVLTRSAPLEVSARFMALDGTKFADRESVSVGRDRITLSEPRRASQQPCD